jgi:beta-1,4-mannosyl-glycoprotein beta-1,4-N-acetylglucosaminyltransferase
VAIIDAFLYNGELDMLLLRLRLMDAHVDRFTIVESNASFSGIPREPSFPARKEVLSPFLHKIDYHLLTDLPGGDDAWEREYFTRDQLRVRVNARDDDTVIISDVDEILNMPVILGKYGGNGPMQVELAAYYFYLNLRSNEKINHNLVTPFHAIRERDIGNREQYHLFSGGVIKDRRGDNGGHFTYQFGEDIERYRAKIRGFSHQELNNDDSLNPARLKRCIRYHNDLFDRYEYRLTLVRPASLFDGMRNLMAAYPEYARACKKWSVPALVRYAGRYTRSTYWKSRKTRWRQYREGFKRAIKKQIKPNHAEK